MTWPENLPGIFVEIFADPPPGTGRGTGVESTEAGGPTRVKPSVDPNS